jgi:hypothetical protein
MGTRLVHHLNAKCLSEKRVGQRRLQTAVRAIAVLSDGHPDSRGHHRRCVVDAIAHVKCLRFSRLLADDVEFFFGTLLSTDLVMPTWSAK